MKDIFRESRKYLMIAKRKLIECSDLRIPLNTKVHLLFFLFDNV